jgi:hypothetical protein
MILLTDPKHQWKDTSEAAIGAFAEIGASSPGFGVRGQYLWLTLGNTRQRPNFLVPPCEQHGLGKRIGAE